MINALSVNSALSQTNNEKILERYDILDMSQ